MATMATKEPDSGLDAIAARHPAVGLAVGIIGDGRLRSFHGHGVADIASGTPVPEDTVFRIGSITKTSTAIAVLQLCERGLVNLDSPAGRYLRAYRLVPAKRGHRPPTVRELLTHTAGLPPTGLSHARVPAGPRRDRGLWAASADACHVLPRRASPDRGAGHRHTYSNHGFATLGQIVEDVTGQPLSGYFREHIFGPLGMTSTGLARSDRINAQLATGYLLRADGAHPVRDWDLVTTGAGAIYSTTADMARYVASLLAVPARWPGFTARRCVRRTSRGLPLILPVILT